MNALRFQLNADQTLIAGDMPSQRVLEISIQAPAAARQHIRPQLNLALVLDRSGSMAGEKLEYVKLAANHVLDQLQEQDRVAVVAYDDNVTLLSPSVPITPDNRKELQGRISQLETGGMTNLSGGWLAGCQEVASGVHDGTINRALLLTDGLANQGITDMEELAQHAREIGRRGVSTSTFGVGEEFNEHLLEAMSNQGSGNFYYIAMPHEIPGLFLREFKELAAVTARDIEIVLELPANVNVQVLGAWRVDISDSVLHIYLGNLFSGQVQEVYVKLLTPPVGDQSSLAVNARIYAKDEKDQLMEDKGELTFEYASTEEVNGGPRRSDVLERFAQVDVAEAANEALKLERRGENDKANRLLKQAIEANRQNLPPEKIEEYQRMAERMKRGMDEADRKLSHFNSYNQKRGRQR